mmetsp:Transcript_7191/g.9333  ORF Transcript_7191/g.9333 Transcript_7191/m.9333 type:complete len:219 (+) Transcript_7191:60-716(+)|eukprot:CAMPEP_0198138718 /NCGR_PEP_ID=MMETSP1443-20131203/2123_1 /TAXON_ID=186043 /ORGANISM="Entomoneis sp., Strain CCMP2396" /LENGTH=218 /DNA_ID=CAMNT_0043800619 /DNA_START=20 /DNA_END=676 /DNA_ORIENTATION=-
MNSKALFAVVITLLLNSTDGLVSRTARPLSSAAVVGGRSVQDFLTTTTATTARVRRSHNDNNNYYLSSTTNGFDDESLSTTFPDNVILYDGVCNFCNTWVDILLRIDFQKKFRFAPLQSKTGQALLVRIGKEADDISSVLLVQEDGKSFHDKSNCVLQVVQELGPGADILASAARQIVTKDFRDNIYEMVAENRYNLMGKRDECRCSDPRYADRFLLD